MSGIGSGWVFSTEIICFIIKEDGTYERVDSFKKKKQRLSNFILKRERER